MGIPKSKLAIHRVAVVQTAPVMFDIERTLEKVADLTNQAAGKGAKLVVFPEATLSAYPKGATFGSFLGGRTLEGRDLFRAYWESASELPGPTSDRLSEIARKNGVNLVIGIIERDGGTLYCTVAHFSETGEFLGYRRKLMPTGIERLTWGFGDASNLKVYDTSVGRVGSVICWENYMPLFRTAMYQQNIQIYCAPTLDERDSWLASMRHVAVEGRCFVLNACQVTQQSDFPDDMVSHFSGDPDAFVSRGASCIIDPFGNYLVQPVYDKEDILVADIDMADIVRGKFDLDVVGHYSRPDLFQLKIDTRPQLPNVHLRSVDPMSLDKNSPPVTEMEIDHAR
ncbi:carbon-nitrogen hydrolase family protein (plasmid) [Rhizobium leguminosarum]|nr:carbon-nitrogen hydrolase family protein [Rhizobium leguminosarum]UIL31570.1 carbon-nitrogen hydrolase family protein [Rhizobium leguminosarum]